MEVRECTANDVISLLHCASDDKDMEFLDNWAQYQEWIFFALYNKKWHVIVVDDGFGVIGFLVWNEYQECWKHIGRLNYIYVSKDFRKSEVAGKLVEEFIHRVFNSSAQRCEFNTKVLSQEWIDFIALGVPHDKYTTYNIPRSEELTRWYNDNFQRKEI